jgi:hypothetical protein
VWELGQSRPPWFRALLLLAPLNPNRTLKEISALPLGTRNADLLALRERLFGPTLDAVATCPHCATTVEFRLTTSALLDFAIAGRQSAYATRFQTPEGPLAEPLAFRLLCSDDLAGVSTLATEPERSRALALRAVLDPVDGASLSDDVLEVVADAILTADPLADIRIEPQCANCGGEWITSVDVPSYLSAEVDREVRRIFGDVHRLASMYGWSEAAILTMSASRRRYYLALA